MKATVEHHHHPQAPAHPSHIAPASALQRGASRLGLGLQRLLRLEFVSGIALLLAAALALAWANSAWADSYSALWHSRVGITLGPWQLHTDLHFLVNEVLMTGFFLVVGMEIRHELHQGALSSLRLASLPVAAALGGVALPALLYLALTWGRPELQAGWAIPTATDIAFAVGILALLGRSIPAPLRIFLLALAIIDDLAAVLIIALFYSGGLDYSGLWLVLVGLLLVGAWQQLGLASAWLYLLPGALVWWGLLRTGAHPTLAGVILGLLTPVLIRSQTAPLPRAQAAWQAVQQGWQSQHLSAAVLQQAQTAQRDLLPPVQRLPYALHPWIAFGVIPLFALANAGVPLQGMDWQASGPLNTLVAVWLALLIGKPLGVVLATWLLVRSGLTRLPQGLSWSGVLLVGLLAGIGFTMSIFIGNLAFSADPGQLIAAKLGILGGSAMAAALGLAYGWSLRGPLGAAG